MIFERATAFLTYALAPYHAHHLLLVPKRHTESISDLSAAEREDLHALQEKAIAVLKRIGYSNFSILIREGGGGGKTIPHVHYHVIPEAHISDLEHWGYDRRVLEDDEVRELMAQIRSLAPADN